MWVTMEIEVSEIGHGFDRAVRCHLTCTDEAPEALRHFNVHQMRRMELVLISKKAGLDPAAKLCLQ